MADKVGSTDLQVYVKPAEEEIVVQKALENAWNIVELRMPITPVGDINKPEILVTVYATDGREMKVGSHTIEQYTGKNSWSTIPQVEIPHYSKIDGHMELMGEYYTKIDQTWTTEKPSF